MKTTKIYIAAAIIGMAALAASCISKENWNMPQDGQIPISLAGDITQLSVTRASDNGFAAGDQVGIWAVNYEEDTPGTLQLKDNQATNVRFTFDGTSWSSDYDIYYKDKNTKVDIYGVYPYSSVISSIEEWPFEVQEDQSTVSAHGVMGGYEASDFLWAKREAVTPSPSTVQLLFQHKMSCVVVTLEEGTGFEAGEFAGLSQSVLINNVKRNATINLSTGEVTATGAVPARSTVPTEYENGFRAIVVPQTVSSACSLFSITLGGVAYTYNQGSAFTYQTGKQHNFTVTVNKKTDGGYDVTVQTSISAWTNDNSSHSFVAKEYVVVNVETPGTLGETLINAGKNPDAIKYLKVLGTVNADDFYYMRDNMALLQGVNLQETKVEEGRMPDGALSGKRTLTTIIFPDGNHNNRISRITGINDTNLSGALIIPEGVEVIDGAHNTLISSITFPSSLKEIGGAAFVGCSALSNEISFPFGLETIGGSAFSGCRNIPGQLAFPESLREIGRSAFYNCSGLTGTLIIPSNITILYADTFYGCGFTGLKLNDRIKVIENGVFQGCPMKGDLVLPAGIERIGGGAFKQTKFSGNLVLPSSLYELEGGVFAYCNRLSGIVEIPESITVINRELFYYCSQLEGVILPSTMTLIDTHAFFNCTGLNTIISYADTPPVISTYAFDGVGKDNFTVEVPEASVNDYIYSVGWNEFNRISAHREFSISSNHFRTLNPEESHGFILRAESGASWHIEDKPEWVTVSPDTGIGKTDVMVTVNMQVAGSGNRSGEIVFILDGKDYRCKMKVEQFDYDYEDGSVIIEQTHSLGSGIPLVFLGDCYDAFDIASGSYLSDTELAIDYFFDIEPYKTYKNYFDVYVVFGVSEDSGVGSVNTIRKSKFGTQYSVTGGSLSSNSSTAFSYAQKADPNMDLTKGLIIMVLNSPNYGGVTYMWSDGSAIAICPKSEDPYPYDFRGLIQHEAGGHGFGKLADEYIYINGFIQACDCQNPHLKEFYSGKANGWYKNLSEISVRDAVPWSHLMYHPTYANTVDIYEGGFFHTRGIFRSEPNSCMNNNIPYYSAISRQAIVERIMDYAGVPFYLDDFYANDVPALGTRSAIERSPFWTPTQSNSSNPKHHQPVIMGDYPNVK